MLRPVHTARRLPAPRVAPLAALRAALLGALLLAGGVVASAGAQQRVARGVAADADASIRIFNLTGSLRVTGWEHDSVAVTGTVGQGVRLMLGGTRQAIKMSPDHQSEHDPGPPSTLEVRVPRGARVWIKTTSAPVTVDGMTGGVDVYTVTGAVTVTGSPRELRAESMDGDVTVTGAPAWARLETASGAIALRGGGGDVRLMAVSGPIALSGGPVERARLETVSGPITFAAAMVKGGSYELDSHGGRVELRVPAGLGVDLEARSIHGEIGGPAVTPDARSGDGRRVTLVSGDAGARVAIRTFKGAIHLRRP